MPPDRRDGGGHPRRPFRRRAAGGTHDRQECGDATGLSRGRRRGSAAGADRRRPAHNLVAGGLGGSSSPGPGSGAEGTGEGCYQVLFVDLFFKAPNAIKHMVFENRFRFKTLHFSFKIHMFYCIAC